MHVFIETVKDSHLAAVAARTGARILPYPLADRADLFTPQDLMRPDDGVHQSDAYAAIVLEQLIGQLDG
jgi:hypothetical protein